MPSPPGSPLASPRPLRWCSPNPSQIHPDYITILGSVESTSESESSSRLFEGWRNAVQSLREQEDVDVRGRDSPYSARDMSVLPLASPSPHELQQVSLSASMVRPNQQHPSSPLYLPSRGQLFRQVAPDIEATTGGSGESEPRKLLLSNMRIS